MREYECELKKEEDERKEKEMEEEKEEGVEVFEEAKLAKVHRGSRGRK